MMRTEKYNVAVVGATGAVGEEMRKNLEGRQFPVDTLRLLASERSAGQRLDFCGKQIPVEVLDDDSFEDTDIALFSAGGSVSARYAQAAVDAGAPEFIDLLCSQNPELADIYTGGLLWLDAQMRQQHGASFLESTEEQQTFLLDRLVEEGDPEKVEGALATRYGASEDYQGFSDYRIQPVSDLAPGVRFFEWLRKMTVDAFYTSPIGLQDVGYQGNIAVSKYEVPEAIIQEALRRSPFGGA